MPVTFCIMPANVDKFKQALISGKLNPDKMASMTSEERHALLAEYVGKDIAGKVNSEFESKLLLKNQQAGMISWAKSVSNISQPTRVDLINRISRMDKFLSPEEGKSFMSDLAERRLGVKVSDTQAKQIMDLSKKVTESELKVTTEKQVIAMLQSGKKFVPSEADLAYGINKEALSTYVGDLKTNATKFKLSDFKGQNIVKITPEILKGLDDLSRQASASLDDSFVGRQGNSSFFTNNKEWRDGTVNSFKNIVSGFKNPQDAERAIRAQLMSHPLYDRAVKDGLFVTKVEDALPKSTLEKIPVIGRPFSASEIAYSGMAHELRMAIYTKNIGIMAKQGINVAGSNAETKGLAQLVNSLTGAGKLRFGLDRASKIVSVPFFSAKFMQSSMDQLLLHPLGSGIGGTLDFMLQKEGAKLLSYPQKVAVKNLAKITLGVAAILELANTLKPGSVDIDPRSSDFGKIRIGDTRFDITGGKGAYVVLAAKLLTGESKSSSTGNITKLNSGDFGAQTEWDAVISFFSNKLSPLGAIVRDGLTGTDFAGNKFNLGSSLIGAFTPLAYKNANELANNPNGAPVIAGMLLDGMGISTNTFSAKGGGANGTSTWSKSTSSDMLAFKDKVGADQFNKAAALFDNQYNIWITAVQKEQKYKDMTSEQKKALMSTETTRLKQDIFKQYNFKYKAPPKVKQDTSLIKALNSISK